MVKQWTPEETTLLERLYPDEQVTPAQMKEIFQCTWPTITGKAKRLCLRRPRSDQRDWMREEIALLERCYPNPNITLDEMEQCFGRSWQSIDDKNGHSNIVLSLNRKDRKLVESFRSDVASGAPIYEGRNNTCKVQITSREMVDDLSKYNIIPNKTNIYTWPQLLPDGLAMSFLLGYFDGDGSLSQYNQKNRKYWHWQLVGTQPFLSVAQEHIQLHAQVEIREPRRCHKDRSPYLYLIYASAQETIRRIDQALNTSGIGLPRKRFPQ
jgi:hypothetical protein